MQNLNIINLQVLQGLLVDMDEDKLVADIKRAKADICAVFPNLIMQDLILSVELSSLDSIHTEFYRDANPNLNSMDLSDLGDIPEKSSVHQLIDIVRAYDALYSINSSVPNELELIDEDVLVQRQKENAIEAGEITAKLAEHVDWEMVAIDYNEYKSLEIEFTTLSESNKFYYKA